MYVAHLSTCFNLLVSQNVVHLSCDMVYGVKRSVGSMLLPMQGNEVEEAEEEEEEIFFLFEDHFGLASSC